MSCSILEVLENARYNLVNNIGIPVARQIGLDQLSNAITLLNKGYSVEDNYDALVEGYDSIDEVPEKSSLLYEV
jgi:hypothetical protein